ncbi:MAG: DNA translocase FtsK 4TM domain-containing protein [Brevinema sp.]
MFKGIFRILISYSLILFSLVLGISLIGFSPNDLIFYTTALSYQNILGYFGAYLAMPFVLFYGQASWIWAVFSLFIGIRILTGIDPKLLLIRFSVTHYLVLLWATTLSLLSNNFSFVSGGIFGSLLASMFTNILPNIVWIPFIFVGFMGGVFSIWNVPRYILQHYFQQPLTEPVVESLGIQHELESASLEKTIEEIELPSEHYGSVDSLIDEYYKTLEQPLKHRDQVPSFLQEIQESEEETPAVFLSKKPLTTLKTVDVLRDSDVDLLSPYMNNDNPFYAKLEDNREVLPNPTSSLLEDLKDTVESLDDLDQGIEPIVPNSKWVRESGVSMGDFVRQVPRLLFNEGTFEELNPPMVNTEETKTLVPQSSVAQDVLDSLVHDREQIIEDIIPHVEEFPEETPQHISNFPPVSTLDNSDPIILPEIAHFSLEEVHQQLNSTDTMPPISESEKLLLQGLERKIKKQQEDLISFREKTRKKHQELADQYYQKYQPSVEEIPAQNIPPQMLTTSFALQDFEQEILELKKRNIDTVSQVLGDDVFFSSQHQDLSPISYLPEVSVSGVSEQIPRDDLRTEIREEDFFINVDKVPEKQSNNTLVTKEPKEIDQEEVIMMQEVADDYQSPHFAALMRLELGDLPDISQFTQDSVQDFSNIRPEELVSEENIVEDPNNELDENQKENSSESAEIKDMIQDFQKQHMDTFGEFGRFTREELVKDLGVLNFDDVISQINIADDEIQVAQEDLQNAVMLVQDMNNEPIEEEIILDTLLTLVDSEVPADEQLPQITAQELESSEEPSKESWDLISVESYDEPKECVIEEMHDLGIVEDISEDSLGCLLVDTIEESQESTEFILADSDSQNVDLLEKSVDEDDTQDIRIEKNNNPIISELEAPVSIFEDPQELLDHTIKQSNNKELLLKNTEPINEFPIEEEKVVSHRLQELDKPELLLMPSVATEGHLIEPMKYPIEQENSSVYFPDIEDLEPNNDIVSKIDEDEEIETTMKMIEDTYESFNINMQVVDYNRGPTITRFELEPPSGLKLRTILNLQDDLALQAGTSNLRIISPVEGRSLIGIEVPNKVRRNFLIREQIESILFQNSDATLPLILGVDVGGREIVGDLATTPHLLIAGTTGSGKSVYVNALIMGLLFKLSSEDLKFIMIDPKMVELELYGGIPHLLAPIITKPEEAMAALEWTVQEMDRRYKILSELGVRNIKEYKESVQDGEKLPYIVVIVDEFANLMLRVPKETEKHISRLASMSRAVGIHLVLATQRPSVDVVTGVIKANFPSRIAFRVSSKIDSRTIIDRNGAETLLGRGDMLFMSPNYMEPIRIQSPYASNEDVARTVNRIKKNGSPEYVIDFSELLARQEENNSDGSRTDALSDPLFEEVLRFSVDNGEISASGIQRRFRVGYNRASRLIESMKDLKIISPPPSAGKGWLINITRDEITNYLD